MTVVVAGQLARDVVLLVDELPPTGTSADARLRLEMLGGKGANQAVSLAQLGVPVALVAVAGDDRVGEELLAQARRDGIDVRYVVRRPGAQTGLIVEALEADGGWRYLQHLPVQVLLTEADVAAAGPALDAAEAVLVQLQQPPAAVLAAARRGRDAGAMVVLDGAPGDGADRATLLGTADVVRADAKEAEALTGAPGNDPDRVLEAAWGLLSAGPRLLALALGGAGNLFVWDDRAWGRGHALLPLAKEKIIDTTGAGDAFTAALTAALLRGDHPRDAARLAVGAAAACVGQPGGRPALTPLDGGRPLIGPGGP
ncbi:PfkB family carbohydrate kinase [Rhizomonospora bruguierae]|uniref:PfkB family carbohydrate kinase n=1 Tax=Rhizomonospora bruguierae TaxID=1581705 RepID=UPI001BCBF984|nr:PfkB family carbohydrate kinase [Micromonospora sp. NBRC 107566]